MQDLAELIDELEHVLSALNSAHDALAFINEPMQQGSFNQTPKVIFYDDGQKLVISFRERYMLKRPVLLKNEDWNDVIRASYKDL